ncbi:MAG: tetratricopeptide repeat protein [Flavobacteriales bacterium]|nr:tetratricopeptide repeat protein [Flavobacteriales bacterium]
MCATLRRSITLSLLLASFAWGHLQAQSGKAFLKEAEQLRADQKLTEALEKYTFAIRTDSGLMKAYQGRAEVYGLLERNADAASDLRRVAALDPSEPEHAAKAALAYLDLGDAAQARILSDKALAIAPKNLPALQASVRASLALGDMDRAARDADAALGVKGTTDTYYLHGLVRMAQHDYRTAETDLERVIEWNYLYEDAYVALAEVQLKLHDEYTGPTMQLRTLDKAVERTTTALELNPRSTAALFTRSKAYAHQKEFAKAIEDISKVIANGRTDADVYFQRAGYYHGFGQQQNAVNDLNRVLQERPKDVSALLLRSKCREANVDLEGAIADMDAAQKILNEDPATNAGALQDLKERRQKAADALFEMNRESDPPIITVEEPYRSGDKVQVSAVLDRVKVTGHVRDRNLLKGIRVNGVDAEFTKEDKDPEFYALVPISATAERIEVEAVDVYDNIAASGFAIERTEGIAPELVLLLPTPSGDRQLSVQAGKTDIFLEGRASDASVIRAITVDGMNASFIPDTMSTEFSIKLPIEGKERIALRAEDQFGNATELIYALTRRVPEPVAVVSPPKSQQEKPANVPTPVPATTAPSATGTTWVIFIENTTYKYFPALQGPTGDVQKMQKAFGKYNVQKTINKKNLSKQQLDRFFSTELRDLVRTNKVNTILVWYAGHGRASGGKSYWVPVDGRKDDIYSFYNYTGLKGLMQNYSESVNNTLVVSDAAGADPSFYELTR